MPRARDQQLDGLQVAFEAWRHVPVETSPHEEHAGGDFASETHVRGQKPPAGDCEGGSQKKMLRPTFRQKPVRETALIGNARISVACRAFGISYACYRYASKLDEENELIRRRLHELTAENLT